MISYISENSRVTLQLVGGLKEESGKGGVLSKRILSYFATHRCNFIPTLVCLGPINTKMRARAEPIVGKILILKIYSEMRLENVPILVFFHSMIIDFSIKIAMVHVENGPGHSIYRGETKNAIEPFIFQKYCKV